MNWGFSIGSTYFNSIDTIMFALVLIGGIGGAITGFAMSFAKSAGYLAGLFVGLAFCSKLSSAFMKTFGMNAFFASLVSFMLLFGIGYIVLCLLGATLQKVFEVADGLEAINRILGFVWGMILMGAYLGLACYFLRMQSLWNVEPLFGKSQFIIHLIDPLTPGAASWVQSQFK